MHIRIEKGSNQRGIRERSVCIMMILFVEIGYNNKVIFMWK